MDTVCLRPDAPIPLVACKQLPPSHPVTPMISLKRVTPAPTANSSPIDISFKRQRTSFPTTPSFDFTRVPAFKVPAVPIRALTPSTSTVAHSSSPRRDLASSPTRTRERVTVKGEVEHDIMLEIGTALIFGRHRHRPTSTITASAKTDLRSAVPNHLIHLLHDSSSSAQTIHLSRHASHSSRVHAVVETISSNSARIVVVGQNGLRVLSSGRARRLVQGQRLIVERDEEGVELDFYGSGVRLAFPDVEEEGRERLFTPPPRIYGDGVEAPASPESTMPPSSPPLLEEMEMGSRGSSPLSSASVEGRHEKEEMMAEEDHKEVREEIIEAVLPITSSISATPPPEILPLPVNVDLPAILASTVVFSGSSKLSLPDLVKHMLEVSPPFKLHV